MKPRTAFIVFFVILASSVVAGIENMLRTDRRVQAEMDYALTETMRRCEPDRIDADTIRVFRSLISEAAVRDSAYLSLAMTANHREPILTAQSGLTLLDLWKLSDQRASGWLSVLSGLWLMLSCWLWNRERHRNAGLIVIGQMSYDAVCGKFAVGQSDIRFTPMQRQLMELFFRTPDHELTQREICDHLWPKKPDATATLYTLIRRLKPLVDDAGLKITCNRGDSYQLTIK